MPSDCRSAAPGIRGSAEGECATVGTTEERRDGVAAQVRIDRQCVGAEPVERGCRVGFGGVADVVALGIEDDQGVRCDLADHGNRVLERLPSDIAADLIERRLRLVGAHEVGRRLDHPSVEGEDLFCRSARRLWIESDANQRVGSVHGCCEMLRERRP